MSLQQSFLSSPLFSFFPSLYFPFSLFHLSIYIPLRRFQVLILPFLDFLFLFQIDEYLPTNIRVVQKSGHPVVWICDPIHGK